jgi:hypothetical protein
MRALYVQQAGEVWCVADVAGDPQEIEVCVCVREREREREVWCMYVCICTASSVSVRGSRASTELVCYECRRLYAVYVPPLLSTYMRGSRASTEPSSNLERALIAPE